MRFQPSLKILTKIIAMMTFSTSRNTGTSITLVNERIISVRQISMSNIKKTERTAAVFVIFLINMRINVLSSSTRILKVFHQRVVFWENFGIREFGYSSGRHSCSTRCRPTHQDGTERNGVRKRETSAKRRKGARKRLMFLQRLANFEVLSLCSFLI